MHAHMIVEIAPMRRFIFPPGQFINLKRMPIVSTDSESPQHISFRLGLFVPSFVSLLFCSFIEMGILKMRITNKFFFPIEMAEKSVAAGNIITTEIIPFPGSEVICNNAAKNTAIIAPMIIFFLFMIICFLYVR